MFAKGDWRALVVGRHKLMWNSRGRHKLHDLGAPAGEDEDRAKFAVSRTDSLLERLEELTGVLPPFQASAGTGNEIDAATRRALEGLGYLETKRDASEDHGQDVPSTP